MMNNNTATLPDLQVMAGYMEHLDQMMEQASCIESSLETLKATYALHQQQAKDIAPAQPTIGWMDTRDIEGLFVQQAGAQKQEISKQLTKFKQMLMDAKRIFAVDAPDGYPDVFAQEEINRIKHLMDEVAMWEDKVEVDAQHAQAVKQKKPLPWMHRMDFAMPNFVTKFWKLKI